MVKSERIAMNTIWGYLRDHQDTPEKKALFELVSRTIKSDRERRRKRESVKSKTKPPQ
jgi:hypothetical protein